MQQAVVLLQATQKKKKERMNAVGFIATAIWCKKLGVCMKFCHLLEFAMIAGFVSRKDREKFSSKISCRVFSLPFHKTIQKKILDQRSISPLVLGHFTKLHQRKEKRQERINGNRLQAISYFK